MSRGAGLVLSVDCTLILLPMCRNILKIIRPTVPWLHLDESQWFHRQVAYAMLLFTTIHTAAHYVNFFNVERSQVRKEAAVQIHYTQPGAITGHIMLFCMLLMYTTAHVKIRKQSFETFWYTHHLFIPFLLGMYVHATGCFVRDTVEPISPFAGEQFWTHCIGYEGWRWELVAGALYLGERIYREIRARRDTEIVRVIKHPFETIEIQVRKPSMVYKPGQWVFINCPSVSRNQWHPFTITSCPFDPYMSIHVRQLGDFTRDLADALGAGPSQAELYDDMDPEGIYEIALEAGQQMPVFRIDGPYGAPAEDVFGNEIAVLIGTGIGVTPFASVLKHIWHLRSTAGPMGNSSVRRLKRIEFIWICRDTNNFAWFQALLNSLEAQSLESNEYEGEDFLRIHTYLTKKLDVDTAQNIVLNTVGADKDPLTELRTRTNFGRPDFKRLLNGLNTAITNGTYMPNLDRYYPDLVEGEEKRTKKGANTNVGVYFCGPGPAAREINGACKAASTKDVTFKFWKEHF